MLTRLDCCVVICLCACLCAHADLVLDAQPVNLKPPVRSVAYVPVLDAPITVDGKLDEPAWAQAAVIDRWLNHNGGGPSDLNAEVRMVAAHDALYVAFRMRGTHGLMLATPTADAGRDQYEGSVLELFLDATGEGKSKLQIVTNPLGLRYDAYNQKPSWNGSWKSAGVVGDDEWTIEMVVPVSDAQGPAPAEATPWKGNVAVYFHREGEQMSSWTGGWGNPESDYGVLYFGTPQQYEQTLRPQLSLFLDRLVYDVRDRTAVALARFDAAGRSNDNLALRLVVEQGDRRTAEQTLSSLAGHNMDCTLDLSGLAEGEYTLRAEMLVDGKVLATATRDFSKQVRHVQPPAVTAGRIPIRVHPQQGLDGISWPISTGVPFAQDSLASAEQVRLLDPAGREVPMQTAVRSTWGRRGSVQWLGVDFVPTLTAEGQTYTLEYGPDVTRAIRGTLVTQQTDNSITVDTGPLRFTVDRKRFALISSATLDGRPVLAPHEGAGLWLVDHEGSRYRSVNDGKAEVIIEEQGPVSVTICAKGWYVRDGSRGEHISSGLPTDRLCQFTVRLTASAGSPLVKVAVSTIMTQDTDDIRLREVSIGLPTSSAAIRADGIELDEGDYVVQDRWDRAVDASGAEHPRLDGLVQVEGFQLAVRRFWQLFPKEVGYANGLLTIHPWPAHGREVFPMAEQVQMEHIYKLRYAHHGRELDFRLPTAYTQALDDYLVEHPKAFGAYYKDMSYGNAQGLTLHNDMVLDFGRSIEGKALLELVNRDPHALADPAYVCETNVLGPILQADPQFSELEETYKRGFLHLVQRQEPANEYGMLIYGNGHTYWNYNAQHAGIHRVWINSHYLIPRLAFVQYARTGDPDWISLPGAGRDIANAVRDIATIHYVSPNRRFNYHQLGAMYHCKGFAPWAGDAHVAAHPICTTYLLMDYYLFGNRRSLDTLNTWLAGLKEASPAGYPTREGMTTLAEMIEVYRLTWDVALVELMDRFRQAILRQPAGDPKYPSWDYHPMLCAWDYVFSGDPAMLQAFRTLVAQNPAGSGNGIGPGGTVHLTALLALIDQKPEMIEPSINRHYADSIAVVDRPGEKSHNLVSHMWYPYIYRAHKYPYALKAFKQFGMSLKRPVRVQPALLPSVGKRTWVVVKETVDQSTPVVLAWRQRPVGDISVRLFGANGHGIAHATRPAASAADESLELIIPVDGQVSEYLIEITRTQEYDELLWPLTSLAHEVVMLPAQEEVMITTSATGMSLYLLPPFSGVATMAVRTRNSSATAVEFTDLSGSEWTRVTAAEVSSGATASFPVRTDAPLVVYATGEARIRFPLNDEGSGADSAWVAALTPDALFRPSFQWAELSASAGATLPED